MARVALPDAPSGLGGAGASLWVRVMAEFELVDAHHFCLLEQCCAALNRVEEARLILDQEGIVVRDRFDQAREHPAVQIELANRRLVAKLLRELGLDIATGEEYSRPPTLSNRGRVRRH